MTGAKNLIPAYFAGPGVFRPDFETFYADLRRMAINERIEPLFPIDTKITSTDAAHMSLEIYAGNVALLDRAKAVIADISPFRGPNMDPGTAWEIGYAVARGLPVFAWTEDQRTLAKRTLNFLNPALAVNAFDCTALAAKETPRDAAGWSIEHFNLQENLMIARSAASISLTPVNAIKACAQHFAQLAA